MLLFMKHGSLFIVTAIVLSIGSLLWAQEGQSLGDVARKMRAAKSTGSPSATPAITPALPVTVTTPTSKPGPGTPEARIDHSAEASTTSGDKIDANAYFTSVQKLFQEEKFQELDQLAATARSTRARFSGGGWHLYTFYLGVAMPAAGTDAPDEEWQALIARLQRWTSARPQSISARVALASAYVDWGWKARGGGLADTVSADAWHPFEERIGRARTVLIQAWELPDKCPQWFTVMQKVARAEGWDKAKVNALLEKAIALEPEYYYNYQEHARFLLPQWYGEEGEAARFTGEIADRIGGKRGDIIYFRIASELDCNCTKDTYLTQTSWPRIRRGYDALEELYGRHPRPLNQIAYMAVKAGDGEYASQIFARIGENWNQDIWQDRRYFETARTWAATSGKEMTRIREAYTAITANLETAEGQRYDVSIANAFNKQLGGTIKDCLEHVPDHLNSFDILLQVSSKGKVEQAVFWPNAVPDGCLRSRLVAASLPTPPAPEYWVKITMNIQH